MDSDSPWEENPHMDHVSETEWTRITSEFTDSGYREGITAGKEAFLQAGFDAGFADVGVPLGRELGKLRGVAAAIRSFLNSQNPGSLELTEELGNISSILSTMRFSDIAPPDLEAEQHAREHHGFQVPPVVEHTEPGTAATPPERRTVEDLVKLKERLNILSAKLGLPALA